MTKETQHYDEYQKYIHSPMFMQTATRFFDHHYDGYKNVCEVTGHKVPTGQFQELYHWKKVTDWENDDDPDNLIVVCEAVYNWLDADRYKRLDKSSRTTFLCEARALWLTEIIDDYEVMLSDSSKGEKEAIKQVRKYEDTIKNLKAIIKIFRELVWRLGDA